jgi:hypothetical protein
MAHYVKISSPLGGSCNKGMKEAIGCIGKYCYSLSKKKGSTDKEGYIEYGLYIISKQCGHSKTAIRKMFEPEKIKGSKNREWWFHKHFFKKAYRYIIKLLKELPPDDRKYIKDFLNNLYQDYCQTGEADSNKIPLCSDTLLLFQKEMLEILEINNNVSEHERKCAGEILRVITEADKAGEF